MTVIYNPWFLLLLVFNKAALAPAEYAPRIPAAISAGGNTAPTLPITKEAMPASVALLPTALLKV